MIPLRNIQCRIHVNMSYIRADAERDRQRKLAYYKQMKAMGIRGTSIHKYLRRGFPGPFVKALRAEMEQLAEDFKRKWWISDSTT